MRKTIDLNGQTIYYELIRKKVKNLNLRIRRDGTVIVSCNNRVPEEVIENFLREKARFVIDGIKRMEDKSRRAVRPVDYETGEFVSVSGEYKVIKVLPLNRTKCPEPMVIVGMTGEKFAGNELFLIVKDPESREERMKVYEKWKRKILRDKIVAASRKYYPMFAELGVSYPKDIKYGVMTSKWGYCRPKEGMLKFSYNLFEVPDEALEYVVVHEFAHFLEANHSERFYRQVARVMPDWKRRRDLLNEFN